MCLHYSNNEKSKCMHTVNLTQSPCMKPVPDIPFLMGKRDTPKTTYMQNR